MKTAGEMRFMGKFVYLIIFNFLWMASWGIAFDASGIFTLIFLALGFFSLFCCLIMIWSMLPFGKKKSAPQIQSAPAPAVPRPPLPKKLPREYQEPLDKLKSSLSYVKNRQLSVNQLIESMFEGSAISIARYQGVLNDAIQVMEENYEHACQAAQLFNISKPTKNRVDILEVYVQDSHNIVKEIDEVVDGLLEMRQSSVLADGERLDQRLEELARTTKYYRDSN